MTAGRPLLVASILLGAAAAAVGAWALVQLRSEPLPTPQHDRTKCAFPEMDFHGLEIGLPYGEVRKRYADHPAQPPTMLNGCVAYRYDSYLFAQGAPTLFITLQFDSGRLKAKWLQRRQPDRSECTSGIAGVVDVGDILYEYPYQRP